MKKFVPFDSFEKGCTPRGKDLAETMQDNLASDFAPDTAPPCSATPCPPYWQRTGETKCVEAGFVDAEEKDGCGNSRWVRTVDKVVWTDTGEEECDTPVNRFKKQQVNQCGTFRLVSTNKLCCTPDWVPVLEGGEPIMNCDQSMLRFEEEDGCGNTRLKANGQAVVWTGTGEARCQPGDIYEIEQTNQCGVTRWHVVGSGCPCIPDWTDVGSQRCTGEFVEQNQIDGCGASRWFNTGTLVVWTPNGETRCGGNSLLQYQQVSQCGTTRWWTSEEACVNSPPPNEIPADSMLFEYCNSGPNTTTCTLMLNAATKLIQWSRSGEGVIGSQPWVAGAVNRADYEARITYVASEIPDGVDRVYSGSIIGDWYNLGDTTTVGGSFTCVDDGSVFPADPRVEWNFTEIRIDIRRVGGSVEGGVGLGPLRIVGAGSC